MNTRIQVSKKGVTRRCDMHRADVLSDHWIVYTAELTEYGDRGKERWQFCGWPCFMSWVIDDDSVLRLYAKRCELPREARHPHGAAKMLVEETRRHTRSGLDRRRMKMEVFDPHNSLHIAVEKILPLDLEWDDIPTIEAALTKEEVEALSQE